MIIIIIKTIIYLLIMKNENNNDFFAIMLYRWKIIKVMEISSSMNETCSS